MYDNIKHKIKLVGDESKLEYNWKSRYKGVVRALVHHSNTVSRTGIVKFDHGDGIMLNHQQYQVFEQIIEHKDDLVTMTEYAEILSVSKSLVSQTAKILLKEGLIRRFRLNDNKKSVILRPTERGEIYYKNYIDNRAKNMFDSFFEALSPFTDEQLDLIEKAILILDKGLNKDNDYVLSPIDNQK